MPDNRIRRITPADVDSAVALVHELADYERSADLCLLTAEALHASLFGPAPALFGHVAEADGDVIGVALWFLNYSTWHGTHGIHLEDLYVRPAHRGGGYGRALLTALAEECVARGYRRLEWSVLDWNTPAIGFYERLGARAVNEWTVFRLTGESLSALGGMPDTIRDSQEILG